MKQMNKIYLYLSVMLVLFAACDKEPYDRFPNDYTAEDITKLELSTNTTHLFANGKAEVEFSINAYYTIDKTVKIVRNNEIIDTTYVDHEVKYKNRNIPEGIEIYTTEGEKVEDLAYSTTEALTETIGFYAKVGAVESDTVSVILEKAPREELQEIVIPIVFHMVETDDYEAVFQTFDKEKVAGIISQLNRVFSNTAKANAPHSVDLKVRFELVSSNPNGKALNETGINRVQLGDVEPDEAYTHLKDNLMWEGKLNIWVCQWDWYAQYDDPVATAPKHITTDPDILPGLDMIQVEPNEDVEVSDPSDIGIVFAPRHFSEGDKIITSIGKFLGLLPTKFYEPNWWNPPLIIVDNDVDYCTDTYTWREGPITIWKTTYPDNLSIKSVNIMDEYTIGSVITYQQGQRVRNVLEYCPLRQYGK